MDKKPGRVTESPARTIDSRESTSVSVETIVDRNSQILQDQTVALENSTNMTNNNNKNSLTNSQISMISNDQRDSHIYTSPDLIIQKPEKPAKEVVKNLTEEKVTIKPHIDARKSVDTSSVKKTTFPLHILLGVVQLVLSVTLAALGGLLLARNASLATTGSGLWAGGIAAIAGALGVINLKKVQTGFLAVSLICVASSTLAMALTGIGLVRDINKLEQQEENIQTTQAAISAGSGLIFALVLHFVVSIASVYHSALKLCARHPNSQMLENVITVSNASVISQQKVEEYIKSMSSQQGREKMLSPEDCDKLMNMWMYQAKRGAPVMNHMVPMPPQSATVRPVMLVPATGNGIPKMLPPGYRHTMPVMLPPGILPPGMMMPPSCGTIYRGMVMTQKPQGSLVHSQGSHRPTSEINKRPHRRRTGRNEASRRQRRKSESDAENSRAFTYTGLDRAIADSFLERQEISQVGSNADYSSSNESSKDGCPDIAM